MLSKRLFHILLGFSISVVTPFAANAAFTEPEAKDYQAIPVFTVNPTKPNILIMFDDSGSMDWEAYDENGTYEGQLLVGKGEEYPVYANVDDAEETSSGDVRVDANDGSDLDFANDGYSYVGTRFRNLEIPKDAVITEAHIEFTSRINSTGPSSVITITAENSTSAAVYTTTKNDISSRSELTDGASVISATWTINQAVSQYDTFKTPDLKDLLQGLVNDANWEKGENSISFKYKVEENTSGGYSAYNASNSTYKPKLYVKWEGMDDEYHKYYGYFNPEWFYEYVSYSGVEMFTHKYKKTGWNEADSCWEVIYPSSYSSPGEENTWNSKCLYMSDFNNEKLWDGNWMNWATSRRLDVSEKVIVGGKVGYVGDHVYNYGEITGSDIDRYFDPSEYAPVNEFHDISHGFYNLRVEDGEIRIDDDGDDHPGDDENDHWVRIEKIVDFDPEDFNNKGEVTGLLQNFGNSAYWGYEGFYGSSNGGEIVSRVARYDESTSGGSTHGADLVKALRGIDGSGNTPLGETLFVAAKYFQQSKSDVTSHYSSNAFQINDTWDPYKQLNDDGQNELLPCSDSFVLFMTDGEATEDKNVPTSAINYTNQIPGSSTTGDNGALDDVAYWAHKTDLRTGDAFPDKQNLTIYPIYLFGNSSTARHLLQETAKYGGYKEQGNNNTFDPTEDEWDTDGDGVADNYFEASNGYDLERDLTKAILDILQSAASGTAVSVLATSSEGEGTISQAYFKPSVSSGTKEITWAGYLQTFWVDEQGNMREDTGGDKTLDVTEDKILRFTTDSKGNTTVNKYAVSDAVPYPTIEYVCSSNDPELTDKEACEDAGVEGDTLGLFNDSKCLCVSDPSPVWNGKLDSDELIPLWEAGKILSETDADDRVIFTYTDDFTTTDSIHGGTAFTKENAHDIRPFLGIDANNTWKYLGDYADGIDKVDRAANLIQYIRGNDRSSVFEGDTNIRKRTIQMPGQDDEYVWKLGDIVHSTPVTVNKPADNYGLIYSDESYQRYYLKYKNRETAVYVGANDGMLHAFSSGIYDEGTKKYSKIAEDDAVEIGGEMWAYIPQSILPHLKWLADVDYEHMYFVDNKPKVIDAKIFTEEAGCSDPDNTTDVCVHPGGWGTVLLGSLRFGGKEIQAESDFDYDSDTVDTVRSFTSSYFAIDITQPRNPELLWEKTYDDLDFTVNRPNVSKVGDDWFLIFGSGPETYEGASSKTGKVYIADLETGEPYKENILPPAEPVPSISDGQEGSSHESATFTFETLLGGQSLEILGLKVTATGGNATPAEVAEAFKNASTVGNAVISGTLQSGYTVSRSGDNAVFVYTADFSNQDPDASASAGVGVAFPAIPGAVITDGGGSPEKVTYRFDNDVRQNRSFKVLGREVRTEGTTTNRSDRRRVIDAFITGSNQEWSVWGQHHKVVVYGTLTSGWTISAGADEYEMVLTYTAANGNRPDSESDMTGTYVDWYTTRTIVNGVAGTPETAKFTFVGLNAGQSLTILNRKVSAEGGNLNGGDVAEAFATGGGSVNAVVTGAINSNYTASYSGSTVTFTSKNIENLANAYAVAGRVGLPDEPVPVVSNGDGNPETAVFSFVDLSTGQSLTILGRTVMAVGGVASAEEVAQAFATGTTVGNAVVSGTLDSGYAGSYDGSDATFIFTTNNEDQTDATATAGAGEQKDYIYNLDSTTDGEYAFMQGAVSVDVKVNYNVDAIYIAQTYDANKGDPENIDTVSSGDWKGGVYRIHIPWSCTGGTECEALPKSYNDYGRVGTVAVEGTECTCSYDDDPYSWSIGKMFSTDRPITIEGSISTDKNDNIWLYYGTGRYLGQGDKYTLDEQYLYGIKDPFFNFMHKYYDDGTNDEYHYQTGAYSSALPAAGEGYFLNPDMKLSLTADNFFDADSIKVMYPWGYYSYPEAECEVGVDVLYGATSVDGDIFGDKTCIGEYEWPAYLCSPYVSVDGAEITMDDVEMCDALANGSPTEGQNEMGDIDCMCKPFVEPEWVCVPDQVNACYGIPYGAIEKTARVVSNPEAYDSYYWFAIEYQDGGCDFLSGYEYVDNDECQTFLIDPPEWEAVESTPGGCEAIPHGAVGDFGTCEGSYPWPEVGCFPTQGDGNATPISSPTKENIDLCYKLFLEDPVEQKDREVGAGLYCSCNAAAVEEPVWQCDSEWDGVCEDVYEGVVHTQPAIEADYDAYFVRQIALDEDDVGCDDVGLGELVNNENCISYVYQEPEWTVTARPAGDCGSLDINMGDEGEMVPDGSCRAGYWACDDLVADEDIDGCEDIDFTSQSGDEFLATHTNAEGVEICKCYFVEEPVARTLSTNTDYDSLQFEEIVEKARNYEGWKRTLKDQGERAVTKPAVIGGLSLYATYVPNSEVCKFGGISYLYALYYETGTAFSEDIFYPGSSMLEEDYIKLKERINLGLGMASTPAIHVGKQEGNKAKVFLEQSTGVIKSIDIDPAFNIRSGLRYWDHNN